MTSGDAERAWLEPWVALAHGRSLEHELRKEVGAGHVLYGRNVRAIARRADQDHVLFELDDDVQQLALVHLTWGSKQETDARWPATVVFNSWSDWLVQMTADHQEFEELAQV